MTPKKVLSDIFKQTYRGDVKFSSVKFIGKNLTGKFGDKENPHIGDVTCILDFANQKYDIVVSHPNSLNYSRSRGMNLAYIESAQQLKPEVI